MKKFGLRKKISVILALMISVLSVYSVFGATYYQDGDWKYEKSGTESDVYYIEGYTGNSDKVQIPALFQTKRVTKINANAFLNKSMITIVSIPATIESIGMNAFYGCSSLQSLSIPASVLEIGPNAFYGCSSLSEVTFNADSELEVISQNTFSGCSSLTAVELPESITTISTKAFLNCTSLTEIVIFPYVESIEADSFKGCADLTICGWNDTYAEEYAAKNSIPFTSLGDYEYPTEPTEPSEPETSEPTTPTESIPETTTQPDTTPSEPESQPDATEPTTKFPEGKTYLIGDSDISGVVNIKDATLIQKFAADIVNLDKLQLFLANCNGEGDVNVKDATQIQKFCAGFTNIRFVGTEVVV